MVVFMKYCKLIWIVITFIILVWIYYLFISPNIFKKREYAVPNISGLSEIDAIRLLEDNDFNYSINYIQGDNNIVSYTYPKEGSMIYKSNTIDVYITKQMSCNYNSFVGLIYDNNIEMINDYCHKYKINLNVLYEENNTYSSGLIFYQSKTVNDIIAEINDLKKNGIDAEAFERAKKRIYGDLVKDYNEVSTIASGIVADYFKNIDSFDYFEEFSSINKEYVEEVLKELFVESKMVVSVIKPNKK